MQAVVLVGGSVVVVSQGKPAGTHPVVVVVLNGWLVVVGSGTTILAMLIPAAFHNTEQYANNRIECDHGRLTARLRPMRGLKRDRSARVIVRGHALMQNVRRGHYELGVDARTNCRVAAAFTELAQTI